MVQKIYQAIILAGGKGTRLGNLTENMPKPLVSVGGIPLIVHSINLLKKNGIKEVIITVNYLANKLQEYLGDGKKWGIHIRYQIEKEPLGTAGSIPLISHLDDIFLVLYGDVMMDVALEKFYQYHLTKKADATLIMHPNDHPYDSDLIEVDTKGRITKFHPKPHPKGENYHNMVNAGLYLFNKTLIKDIPKGIKNDFGKDIFPKLIQKRAIYGYNTSEYLKDFGTPDRLAKVEADFQVGKIRSRNLSYLQKAIFMDRDGVINEDRPLIHKKDDFVLYDYTNRSIEKINQSNYLSVIVTNQSVVARNLTTIEGLEEIHKKMETDMGNERAKLDAIYYCPYHPDKGYPEENPAYKKEHPWRKPNPGMLLQAAKDFNIDLKSSYIIGDRESDIQAGKNAGVTTIGVLSGHGLKSGTGKPDYIFHHLEEAINFIVDDPLNEVYKTVKNDYQQTKHTKYPYIIAVGGQTQSGKSTLASYLRKKFLVDGISIHILSLDHWLIAKNKRKQAIDVFERFNIHKMNDDLLQILKGESVIIDGYSHNPNEVPSPIHYCQKNEKILIIEGIPALSINFVKKNANFKLFLAISKKKYCKQFRLLYHWKGFDKEEIELLLESRLKDEFVLIDDTKKNADIVVSQI